MEIGITNDKQGQLAIIKDADRVLFTLPIGSARRVSIGTTKVEARRLVNECSVDLAVVYFDVNDIAAIYRCDDEPHLEMAQHVSDVKDVVL